VTLAITRVAEAHAVRDAYSYGILVYAVGVLSLLASAIALLRMRNTRGAA
jgi:hypothetical protein